MRINKKPVGVNLNDASKDFYRFTSDLGGAKPKVTGIQCNELGACSKAMDVTGSESIFL